MGKWGFNFLSWTKVIIFVSWFRKPYLVDRSIPAILFSRLSAPFGGKSCRLRSFVQPQLATGITWQRIRNSDQGSKNGLGRVWVQILRLFRQKRWARCCLHTDGFVRTGPACESRREALMTPPSPTAAGTISQTPHPMWGFSSAPFAICYIESNLSYNFQS